MSPPFFSILSPETKALSLLLHLACGSVLGRVYFGSIWRSARSLARGRSAAVVIASALARFVLLGLVLALASFEGAPPLLAMALGLPIGRAQVMRRASEASP